MWRILHSVCRAMKSRDWVVLVSFGFNYSLGLLFWNYNRAIQAELHQLLSLLRSINWNSRSHTVRWLLSWAVRLYKIQNVMTGPVCSLETLIINNTIPNRSPGYSPSFPIWVWTPRVPAPGWWSAPRAGQAPRPPAHSSSPGAWLEVDPSDPWENPSWPPPWPSRPRDTSGTCRTGSGSASACPRGSSCPPGRRTWRSSEPFSWRSPCSPRRFSPRSADTRRGSRTRRRASQSPSRRAAKMLSVLTSLNV